MKNFISRYPGIFIGCLFTYASLIIHKTIVLAYVFTSFVPLVFETAYRGSGGTSAGDVVNMYIFLALIILFLLSSLMYYTVVLSHWGIENLSFTVPLVGFMFLQLFLIHPILLYTITFNDWYGVPENLPIAKTNQTFWISSFAFIILGYAADVLRKRSVLNGEE